MTCIAGVAKNGKVWIGGDTLGCEDDHTWTYKESKVFKHREFLYGFAGEYRGGQVIQHLFVEPEHKRSLSDSAYLCGPFMTALRKIMEENKQIVEAKEGETSTMSVTLLVGYRGKLYSVDEAWAVLEHVAGYDACGSGRQVALGALAVTATTPPDLRIRKALEAAQTHVSSVRGPFTVLSLGTK